MFKQRSKEAGLILLLALFWFESASFALAVFFPWEWAYRCGLVNMIIGLLGLLIVTRIEEGDLLFYKGQVKEQPEEGFNFVRFSVALLWIIPFTCMFVGVGWWIMIQLLHWLNLFLE